MKESPGRKLAGNPLAWSINEAADQLAVQLADQQQVKEMTAEEKFFPESGVMVQYRGRMIHGNFYDTIPKGEHGPALQQYVMDKYSWTLEVFESIDWRATKSFVSTLAGTRETNVIKLLIDWQNDAHQNDLFYEKGGTWPACSTEQEDHLHFLSCKDKVYKVWQKTSTTGIITRAFREVLTSLCARREPTEPVWKYRETWSRSMERRSLHWVDTHAQRTAE